MPDGQPPLFWLFIIVIHTLCASSAQQLVDNMTSASANQCNELLHCENDMMAIHKRCTEQSRKATAQACQLTQQFVDLNRLMDTRVVEFQKCVLMENSTDSTDFAQSTELEGECNTNLLEQKQPLVRPQMGCWKAVAIIRSHCQKIRKCCPSADSCMKQMRSSQATKSLRAKHIEINKKTLECRNQMRKVLTEMKDKSDSATAVQAKYHAVLIAQKKTKMGVIKQKYFSKLSPLDHKANPRKLHKKPVYAAPRAKTYPNQKKIVTPPPKPPTYQSPIVELTKVRKLKTFDSDPPKQSSVASQLAKFEGLLSGLEKNSINSKMATVKFKQNMQLPHSNADLELITKPSIDTIAYQDSVIHPFLKKPQLRRSKKHFPEQVFSESTLSPNLLASDDPKPPPTNSQEVGGDQAEDKPAGIFQMEVKSGVAPRLFVQPQAQAFALPSNVDINRLKVLAARPNHSWRQSNQKRRVAMAGQLLAQGRLNLLGKRVPLVKALGVGARKEKPLGGVSEELVPFSQPEVPTIRPSRRPLGWATNKRNLSSRMRTLAASWHKKSINTKTGVKKVDGDSRKRMVSGKSKAKKKPIIHSTTTSSTATSPNISPFVRTSTRSVPFARLDEDGQEFPRRSSNLQSSNFQMSAPTEVILDEKEAVLADRTAVLQDKNNLPFMATPSPHLERTVASVKEWSWRTTIAPTTTAHGLRDHEATILPPPIDFDSGTLDWKSFTISSEIRRKPTSIALPIVDDSVEGGQPTENISGKQIHITMPAASTTTTPSMPNKKKGVIDTILARKQLQRIMVPLGSGMVGGRVVGYRNKVLHARRQLTRLVDASTEKRSTPAWPPTFKMFKKNRSKTEKHQLQPVAQSENSFQRTTLGVNPSSDEEFLVTISPRTEIRRAPTKLPPPPAAVTDPSSENSDPEDELLLVKHNLILNLEKFLDERKDQVKRKLELRLEKDRLEVLRKSKSESDLKQQLTGYCEIYSTCIDQMKYVQNKCQQLPDGSRIDIVHLELEESIENCLVEEIATGTAKVSESCPAEWPTLSAFNDDSNNCAQKVSLIQNHCKKLGRCCTSLNSCRQSADNSVLAKRLKLEEERLKKKSAECQIQSYDEYRRLRALQQRTNEQQLSSLSEQQSTPENVQMNVEDRSEQKRHLI